jgi:hypothetical protein
MYQHQLGVGQTQVREIPNKDGNDGRRLLMRFEFGTKGYEHKYGDHNYGDNHNIFGYCRGSRQEAGFVSKAGETSKHRPGFLDAKI